MESSITDTWIGYRIRAAAQGSGLLSGRTARDSPCTDSQRVSCHENGKIPPSLDGILRIAQTLDITIDHLLIDDMPRCPLHVGKRNLGDRVAALSDPKTRRVHCCTCSTPSTPKTASRPSRAE